MNEERINQLLWEHFKSPVPKRNLSQLQSAVWEGIDAQSTNSMFQLLTGGSGNLRFGYAFAALIVGILLGSVPFSKPTLADDYMSAKTLGFNLFSSASHPLMKTNL